MRNERDNDSGITWCDFAGLGFFSFGIAGHVLLLFWSALFMFLFMFLVGYGSRKHFGH